MNTDIKTLVMDWTDAINRHDPDACVSFMDEQCVFTNIGTGQRDVGRLAIAAHFTDLFAAWSDLHIDKTTILSDGDSYATEWVMTGVHTGDLPSLPATGRSFRLPGACVGQVRNGKLANVTEYWNLADFLRQVGALPAKAG